MRRKDRKTGREPNIHYRHPQNTHGYTDLMHAVLSAPHGSPPTQTDESLFNYMYINIKSLKTDEKIDKYIKTH